MESEDVKKIIELIKQIKDRVPDQELEKTAQDIRNLATFIVQLHLKQHSKHIKTSKEDRNNQETARAP